MQYSHERNSIKELFKEFITFNIVLMIYGYIITKIFNTPLILSLLWLLLSNILYVLQDTNIIRTRFKRYVCISPL